MRLWVFLLYFFIYSTVQAQTLVADLSDHTIEIKADFKGTDLLLFGSIDSTIGPEDNLLILIKGPNTSVKMRKKDRHHGIWMNRSFVEFGKVPSFYRLYVVNPLEETVSSFVKKQHKLGFDTFRFPVKDKEPTNIDTTAYKQELIQRQRAAGLYEIIEGAIEFPSNRLFRVAIEFPKNTPTGYYSVDIFLLRGGMMTGARNTPLHVLQDGVGADVTLFAQRQSLWYGLLAVAIAIAAGWLAAEVFKRK